MEEHSLCIDLNLKGRIRISKEGINGTLSGEENELRQYMTASVAKYGDIHWKTSGYISEKSSTAQEFQELSVKVTKEVVSLDLNSVETELVKATPAGVHLTPEEFHRELQIGGEDIVLIDVRNIYEIRIG